MSLKTVIKKVPGNLPPPSKKENQGYIEDLGEKAKFELEELLNRQNKILSNKAFISKLPDKGEKITAFRDKILRELEHRKEVENAAILLSRLNVASEGKAAMNELEWTGKYDETKNDVKLVELDSDDEEDPLRILAQPTGSGVHKKKVIHLPPEESLIEPEDLAEIESFETKPAEHVSYIVNKIEKPSEERGNKRESFKPYKTTKSNVHDPERERQRKYNKHWEVTAATPPLIVHGAVKVINLNESLKLQREQAEKVQKIQSKHAAERLAEQLGLLHNIDPVPENLVNYRVRGEKESDSSASENEEENEVHDDDDEDNDKRGTVVYTVDSIEN